MGQHMKKFTLPLILIIASFNNACSIKPPDDNSALGPEISVNEINNAKSDARAGYTFAQAFRTGDNGTVQIVDSVLGNKSVRDANQLIVTDMKPGIAYVTETDTTTGSVISGQIGESDWAATQSSLTNRVLKFFAALPLQLSEPLSTGFLKASRLITSLRIEKSQALGETLMAPTNIKSFSGVLQKRLENNIAQLFGGGLSMAETDSAPSAAPSPSTSPVPSPSPTPKPTATPVPTPVAASASHFYNLQVLKHEFLTSNHSQIPGGKVNSTRIDYVEIRKVQTPDQSMQDVRLHWTLEISNEVPGLFVFLEQCYSTIVNQNNQQIPLTECVHVDNFEFGSGTVH
jgi:hypothetical protein